MSKPYTLENIITSARNRGGLNVDASAGTGMKDDDLILLINEEMDELVTVVLEANEEYFAVHNQITPVASTSAYRIDPRALYQQIKHIFHQNDTELARRICVHIDSAEQPVTLQSSDTPMYYFIKGNDIVFRPDISNNPVGYYDCYWYFKPGTLVKSTECRQVSNVAGQTVTFGSNLPAGWTAADKFDIHSKHSGAEIKQWDLSVNVLGAASITFNEPLDGTVVGRKQVEIGDWVCLEQEAALPGLPTELHPALAQAVICRLAESTQNTEAVQLHTEKLNRMIQVVVQALNPRVETSKKVVASDSLWNYLLD